MEPIFFTPNDQLQHLEPFARLLIEKFQPQQLICFAGSLVTEEKSSCFTIKEHTSQYHCCLLMVLDNAPQIHYTVQDFSSSRYKNGRVTIICHDQATINKEFAANSRFFISVNNKGRLIYSQNGSTGLDLIPYIPTLAAEKATKHLNYRMPIAEGFLAGAYECFINKQYEVSTFMLHQVVEQCCILLIRVHMGYRSELHNLYRLLGLCTSFSKQPYELFFSGSKEDQRLFEVLVKSYSKSRYSSQFKIEEQDTLSLYERSLAFLTLTNEMCRNEIEALEQHAKMYNKLN